MISMVRIDDRLVHGQVAVMWSKALNINRILVVSDEIAKNEIQISALMMAAPGNAKVSVRSLDKAVGILKDPRAAGLRILVITNDPKYVLGLAKALDDKFVLNVANYGRINGSVSDKLKISDSVYLTEADRQVFEEISAEGIEIIHQPLPDDPKLEFTKLMGKVK
ncbi:PTS system, mannose-specific IIB component [Propionibacterium cyclohexanicum]|uniref:PTS system, mannose-specific IIB component n=1 Tax=Propionibacterium cyclohexanicum TaxID=64702 RepID=A0A1H9SWV4_9ACTN|nr:PTS sugar transporter subunit IIB [Propionibacterium cyclohexanicum]SER89294.1 PTS system, mannose-specific IIB component [Propionibacterium cyclohexanicum]